MYIANRYNLNFNVAAILLCLLIHIYYFRRKDRRQPKTLVYLHMLVCLGITAFCDFSIAAIQNTGMELRAPRILILLYIGSRVLHTTVAYLGFLYLLNILGVSHRIPRWQIVLLSIPEGLMALVGLLPVWRVHAFRLVEGKMVHGQLYPAFYWTIVFYALCLVIMLIFYGKELGKSAAYIALILSLSMAIMVVSVNFPYLKCDVFVQMLLLLGGMLTVDDDNNLFDSTTRLYNRYAFGTQTQQLLNADYSTGVVMINLVNTEYYSSMFGVENMEGIAEQIGRYLGDYAFDKSKDTSWLGRSIVGKMLVLTGNKVIPYRLGPDRFALVMLNTSEGECIEAAERIRDRFRNAFSYKTLNLTLTAQYIVSMMPEKISTPEQLMAFADGPVSTDYVADRIHISDQSKEAQKNSRIEMALRSALKERRLEVVYQPIYDTVAEKIHSAEALLRVDDPLLGTISAEDYIRVAEERGIIHQIGAFTFEQVCKFLRDHGNELPLEFIEVNLSTIQFMDAHLADRMLSVCKKYGVDPRKICLEITETALVRNTVVMERMMKQLMKVGFTFALDDFGTGYANYDYLLQFPFALVKVDKNFLWSADYREESKIILRGMLSVIRDLKLKTVMEGVETEEQKKHLVEAGVNYLQGYLYSPALRSDEFVEYLNSWANV